MSWHRRLTTEEFIARARAAHGKKYGYGKVVYVNSAVRVTITCQKHGDFEQFPLNHLRGCDCSKCSHALRGRFQRLTTKEFVARSRKVHGNRYGYRKAVYSDGHTKVIITCAKHGDFEQDPFSHMAGAGCHLCSGGVLLTTEEFIAEARAMHGDRYNYDKVRYVSAHPKVTIACSEHGDFEQSATVHMKGHGCPECSYEQIGTKNRLSRKEFIAKARKVHGNKYGYGKVVYKTSRTKVTIACSEHGDFEQVPNSHMSGMGCDDCGGSKELTIAEAEKRCPDMLKGQTWSGARRKYWFLCKKHGNYRQSFDGHDGVCPCCGRESHGEHAVRKVLTDNHIKFTAEHRIPECRNSLPLPFDFAAWVGGRLHLIEFHGVQHYKHDEFFGGVAGFRRGQHRDRIKEAFCKKHGIPLLVIPYTQAAHIEKLMLEFFERSIDCTKRLGARVTPTARRQRAIIRKGDL